MSTYCTLLDVKYRLTGDVPNMGTDFDTTIGSIIPMVSGEFDREIALVRGQRYPGYVIANGAFVGQSWTPTSPQPTATRRYTGKGWTSLLLIDDAVSVSSVALLDAGGNVIQTLVLGIDYLPQPLNDTPIVGLRSLQGAWPNTYGGVQVTLVPGLMATLSDDIHNACIEEVAQVYLSSQAGGFVGPKILSDRASLTFESYTFPGGLFR